MSFANVATHKLWYIFTDTAPLSGQNFAVSVASAQLEEGTILVDPASGNVTSIPSDGGRFAPFQVRTPSPGPPRARRAPNKLTQPCRHGAAPPQRNLARSVASRKLDWSRGRRSRFTPRLDVHSLRAQCAWTVPVCSVARACLCERSRANAMPPGPAQPALHRRLHRRARPQPLRQVVCKETAAAKWWVKRRQPTAASGESRDGRRPTLSTFRAPKQVRAAGKQRRHAHHRRSGLAGSKMLFDSTCDFSNDVRMWCEFRLLGKIRKHIFESIFESQHLMIHFRIHFECIRIAP